MNFLKKLSVSVDKNNSLLCVGLDSDTHKLPAGKSQFDFNKEIVDATADLVCAFKANSAFYEGNGAEGIAQLQQTIAYIHNKHSAIPVIVDAKRADIGNTNDGYVDYIFNYLNADATTLHPYLGREALEPFLNLEDKGMIILCRTSNSGVEDTQDVVVEGKPYYQYLAGKIASEWNVNKNCLLVVGATYPKEMREIRELVGDDMTFLVPGVGAQGGDAKAVIEAGQNSSGDGLIVNSARGIIFADNPREEAKKLHAEINKFRGGQNE